MTKSTKVFYTVLVIFALVQFSKFLFPSPFLKQFHLDSPGFAEWSCLQTVPSMYNYSNRAWVSRSEYDPLTLEEIVKGELDFTGIQINHYPARLLTFRQDRKKALGLSVKSVYLRSTFARESRFSVYSVILKDEVATLKLEAVHVEKR